MLLLCMGALLLSMFSTNAKQRPRITTAFPYLDYRPLSFGGVEKIRSYGRISPRERRVMKSSAEIWQTIRNRPDGATAHYAIVV